MAKPHLMLKYSCRSRLWKAFGSLTKALVFGVKLLPGKIPCHHMRPSWLLAVPFSFLFTWMFTFMMGSVAKKKKNNNVGVQERSYHMRNISMQRIQLHCWSVGWCSCHTSLAVQAQCCSVRLNPTARHFDSFSSSFLWAKQIFISKHMHSGVNCNREIEPQGWNS